MPLKTLVKVGKITNLNDARYCSGMGVDMLGFQAVEGNDRFLPPSVFQEIRGWISGPEVVTELYGLTSTGPLLKVIEDYKPDYLEISTVELPYVAGQTKLPLIVTLDRHTKDIATAFRETISFVQLNGNDLQLIEEMLSKNFAILATLHSPQQLDNLFKLPIKGLALTISNEIAPGVKKVPALADILEELESD